MKRGTTQAPRKEFNETSRHLPRFDLLGLNSTKSCLKFKFFLVHVAMRSRLLAAPQLRGERSEFRSRTQSQPFVPSRA